MISIKIQFSYIFYANKLPQQCAKFFANFFNVFEANLVSSGSVFEWGYGLNKSLKPSQDLTLMYNSQNKHGTLNRFSGYRNINERSEKYPETIPSYPLEKSIGSDDSIKFL